MSERAKLSALVAVVVGLLVPVTLLGLWTGADDDEGAADTVAAGSRQADRPQQEQGTTPARPGEIPSPLNGEGGPCSLSKRLPDQQPLANISSVPHWAPHSQYASAKSRTASWSCAAGVVVFEYESGVDVGLEPEWGSIPHVANTWQGLAEQQGRGRVLRVRGQPALVQEPGPERVEVGQVMVIDQETGTLIRVLGNGKLPADALAKIAASVR